MALILELPLFAEAWEIVTYAMAYAEGHVREGYWDRQRAAAFVAISLARNAAPLVMPVVIAILLGVLIRQLFSRR